MQAMPDDVIKIDNGIMRFEGPGRYARNVDLDAEPMKTIVATMAAKKIYSDPTMERSKASMCRRMVICLRPMHFCRNITACDRTRFC